MEQCPIDNTDISHSFAAVGQEFRFPLDVEILSNPTLNDDSQSALFNYLRHVSCNSTFANSVLQLLIEERREYYRNRANLQRDNIKFKVEDVVKAHVTVQSNADIGAVSKLSYQAKGPFLIVEVLDHDSYLVREYNNPNGATQKYKSCDLYLLPPQLFPCDELDIMDTKYLNYSHAPLFHQVG